MMRSSKKIIMAIVILICIALLSPETYAADRANIAVESDSLYTITNKGEEKLLYDDAAAGDSFTGTMKTHFQTDSLGDDDKRWSVFHDEFTGIEYWLAKSGVVVNDSDVFRFTYIPTEADFVSNILGMWICVLMTSKKHPYTYMETAHAQEAKIGIKTIEITAYEDEYCQYAIDYRKSKKGTNYSVDGYTNDKLVFKKDKKGFSLEGAVGKTRIEIFDPPESHPKNYVSGTYYFFGDKVKIRAKNGKLIVSDGIKLTAKKRRRFTNVRLRTVNKGKDMFLTWNRVKGAQSYVVYRYDRSKKKYVWLTDRGEYSNYCRIRNVKKNEVQRFKIAARKKEEGEGKNVCRHSYAVWGINGNRAGNVGKVVIDKRKVTGKKGRRIKLNAGVASSSRKPVLTTKVRWYTSNKRIATVSKTKGIVKLKKKGKCKIWAKAHNGVNSKVIVVRVK